MKTIYRWTNVLLALALYPTAHAQWSCDPTQSAQIANSAAFEYAPSVAVADDGSMYVAYLESNGASQRALLTRLDQIGQTVWGPLPISAPSEQAGATDLLIGPGGDAIVLWSERAGLSSEANVYFRRFATSDGTPSTPMTPSLGLTANSDHPNLFEVEALPNGDYAVLYSGLGAGVFLHRVSANGAPQLGAPIQLVTGQVDAVTASLAPNADVVVAWVPEVGGGQLLAQRFSTLTGAPIWANATDVTAALPDATGLIPAPFVGASEALDIASATDDSHLVVFSRTRAGSNPVERVVDAVRLGASGAVENVLLVEPDVSFTGALISVVADVPNGVYYIGIQTRTAVTAQRTTLTGSPLWGLANGPEGKSLVLDTSSQPLLERRPVVDVTADGDLIMAWLSPPSTSGTGTGASVARATTLGQIAWTVDVGPSHQLASFLEDIDGGVDAQGNLRVAWSAEPSGVGMIVDVYAHGVDASGASGGSPPTAYCAGTTSGAGCAPTIGALTVVGGGGGASQLLVTVAQAPAQKAALFIYGLTGSAQIPLGNGTLCVMPPTRRAPLAYTAGTPASPCSGSAIFDFAAWSASGLDAELDPGDTVNGQWFIRDGQSPGSFVLSDGLEWYACP